MQTLKRNVHSAESTFHGHSTGFFSWVSLSFLGKSFLQYLGRKTQVGTRQVGHENMSRVTSANFEIEVDTVDTWNNQTS